MPFLNLILRYLIDYTELILNKMKFTQLLLANIHDQFHEKFVICFWGLNKRTYVHSYEPRILSFFCANV
jgi:hypothetical protein